MKKKIITMSDYIQQMAEGLAIKIDDSLKVVVKPKPKWMPKKLYEAVIKDLVEIQLIK